jgi:hypothetical protein
MMSSLSHISARQSKHWSLTPQTSDVPGAIHKGQVLANAFEMLAIFSHNDIRLCNAKCDDQDFRSCLHSTDIPTQPLTTDTGAFRSAEDSAH